MIDLRLLCRRMEVGRGGPYINGAPSSVDGGNGSGSNPFAGTADGYADNSGATSGDGE